MLISRAMIPITTSSSTKVNPVARRPCAAWAGQVKGEFLEALLLMV
jgi:hypothetical protein